MSTLSIRIPDSIHKEIKKQSKKDNISNNQFISSAVTEKLTALNTADYLQEKTKKGDLKLFLSVLNKVKNIESDEE